MEPIAICDYDPQWPEIFEARRLRIAGALGHLVAAIEHVGSTAVPSLGAKPIIDLDVLLKSADDLVRGIERLALLGYEHEGNLGVIGREAFRTPPGAYPHHLYVCPPGSLAYQQHIAFRDYLRAHPQDADAYCQLKRDLARRLVQDRCAYTSGKSEFVRRILNRARMSSGSRNSLNPSAFWVERQGA